MSDFKIKTGCAPCNFVCDCCNIIYYRCSTGVPMYYRGNEDEPSHIYCENCIRFCDGRHCIVYNQGHLN